MVLSIKSDHADRLARELAALTGESITDVVTSSLEQRLALERKRHRGRGVSDIVERYKTLPVLDDRPADELLQYDEHGLPA
jgi:antitoxin VapB